MNKINKVDYNEKLGKVLNISKFAEALRNEEITDEVMTTSDFAHMADLIDRGVMTGYTDKLVPTTYDIIGYRRDTVSFESGRDYRLNKVKSVPKVAEKGQYLPNEPSEEHYHFKTDKYGCQFDISWEAYLRDGRDLRMVHDLFEDASKWGASVEYSKEEAFTAAFADNATLFATHDGVSNDLGEDLDLAGFLTVLSALKSFRDPAGNVSPYGGNLYLVVPVALEATAQALMMSSYQPLGVYNPAYNAAQVVTNHFLTDESVWYLFCDPRIRPAVRYGYVSGYEQPEIFIKSSDAESLMGGTEDPFAGSFDSDDIEFKLRFSFGADLCDWRGAIRSDTAG